ncbi:hypothetical protein K439DRAFT_1620710 [Ramaria rubella]|nr:hypothetical protein K439DRAFT_1620710 [Ramaria rubella]
MTNSNPSTVTALHLRMPNCDIKVRVKSSRGREPIEIKIVLTLAGSVELTLVAMAAPDQGTEPFLISTPFTPIATTASSLFMEAAAPNDKLEHIDPRLLLGKEPSTQASSSSLKKHS